MTRVPTFIVVMFTITLFLFWISPGFCRDIRVPVDSYPPFHIFPPDGGPPYGETIAVIRAVVARVNQNAADDLSLNYTRDTPFKRCLALMRSGRADLIGSLLDKEDRRDYMILLKYKANSNKVFIQRRNDSRPIHQFDDLKGLTVGTVLGYQYFSAFDTSESIVKDPARNLSLSLAKLEAGRCDVVICTQSEWLSLTRNPMIQARFRQSQFRYEQPNPVYLGISRKSWLAEKPYIDVFRNTVSDMFQSGEFIRVISRFYESYTP
ncbi:MAG: ABC transporter substrate-binding protein [Desulfobacteraceae bacterium]|nr:MAG: ABC transporter substrate-binding protein [Desulfobacteraceae bacterium]